LIVRSRIFAEPVQNEVKGSGQEKRDRGDETGDGRRGGLIVILRWSEVEAKDPPEAASQQN